MNLSDDEEILVNRYRHQPPDSCLRCSQPNHVGICRVGVGMEIGRTENEAALEADAEWERAQAAGRGRGA